MKSRLGLLSLSVLLTSQAMAFDGELYNAAVARREDPETRVLALAHGFRTKITSENSLAESLPDKSFGFSGANVGLLAHSYLERDLAWRLQANLSARDYALGLAWQPALASVPRTRLLVDLHAQRELTEWKYSSFALGTADSGEYLDSILRGVFATLSLGHDSYHQHTALVLALSLGVIEDGHLFAEFFPRLTHEARNPDIGDFNTWDLGWRWTSGGHEFFFLLSNSPAVDTRQAMLGTNSRDLNFAFKVTRAI
jgi:hypothetical protein